MSGKAKSLDNLLLKSKSGSRLVNFFGRGSKDNLVNKVKKEDEMREREVAVEVSRGQSRSVEIRDVKPGEVVTEKITKLSKSSIPVYIEASEVRRLKAIDEHGHEHEVRKTSTSEVRKTSTSEVRKTSTSESVARRLETHLDVSGSGGSDEEEEAPVKAAVVGEELRYCV
jgi:hypothetical protein